MPKFDPKVPDRGAVRSQVVGDQPLRNEGILLQELAHQFQRGVLVSLGLDQHVEDLALSVDGPPKVGHSTVDFQIDLVQMPRRARLRPTLSQLSRDHRSEMVHPTPNGLVRHLHSALRQQILDVAQAEGEPEVEPYRLMNDLRRETIPAVADFLHPLGYSATGRIASPTRCDNAVWYADVPNKRCVRVREGGELLQTIALDRGGFACMLGGADRRTLFIAAAHWRGPETMFDGARTGQLLTASAPAPGVGWP